MVAYGCDGRSILPVSRATAEQQGVASCRIRRGGMKGAIPDAVVSGFLSTVTG